MLKTDIFAATESWLHSDIDDNLLHIPNYSLFRDDRKSRRGGGVCIWLSNAFSAFQIFPVFSPPTVDSLWLAIPNCKLIFICIYFPPDCVVSQSSVLTNFIISQCDLILSTYHDFDIFLCGDFNRLQTKSIEDSFDLVNVVNEPTRGNATLDLFLVTASLVSRLDASVEAPVCNSDHRCVYVVPKCISLPVNSYFRKVYDLRQHNIDRLVSVLEVNWSSFYRLNVDVNTKCNLFYDHLRACIDACIPHYDVLMTNTDKPWITPLAKLAIQNRWNAYRDKDFPRYRYWKEKARICIQKAKASWAQRAGRSSSDLWKVTNVTLGTKCSDQIAQLVSSFPSIRAAAESINRSFCDSYTSSHELRTVETSSRSDLPSDWSITVTVSQVEQKLSRLKTSKATGSDGVPACIYKAAASVLAGPLTHIFNMSIQSRVFPRVWKHSNVVPLPKSPKPSIDKLRPISLLPVPSKVFEQLVLHSHLHGLFLQSFGDSQYGSRPNSSTTCAIIKLINFVTSALDKLEVAGVQLLAYDYSKAFDVLGHSTIIERLQELSFPAGFIAWITDYLTGRSQAVQLGNTLSSALHVTSGVPQGSVLGPALYCLVAGGLQKVNDSSFIMKYIDDVNFAIPVLKTGDSPVASEHSNICAWSESYGITINERRITT